MNPVYHDATRCCDVAEGRFDTDEGHDAYHLEGTQRYMGGRKARR